MNDFTKDELEDLLNGMELLLSEYDFGCNLLDKRRWKDLLNKVQSLIDNYCDHEHDLDNYDESACKKCGIKLD